MNLWGSNMWQDPIIEQIHKIRQEHARKFNYDLRAIYDDLKQREKKSKQKKASLPIKRRIIKKEKAVTVN